VPDHVSPAPFETGAKANDVSAVQATHVLSFVRGGITCAVEGHVVRGVSPKVRMTRVPGAPRQIRGLISWRGTIVPLVDASETFTTAWNAAVVVSGEHGDIAIAADSVEGWIDRASATLLLDVDAIQTRLRERIRRGLDSDRPSHEENEP
jgi:chemotaxis signal transduction protein